MHKPLQTRLTRREALGVLGTVGASVVAACGGETPTSPTAVTPTPAGTTTPTTGSAACVVSPSETAGPYPSLTHLMRSDIREGSAGLPLVLVLTVVNVNNTCSPVANASVEIWQCDAAGHYSQYSQPGYDGRAQTYLRGIQTTDSAGRVTFTTVYPGWYAGRATHIHVEVTINGRSVKVTQIAFPEAVNAQVYSTAAYASRGNNPTSNASDMVFADSLSSELAVMTGDTTTGFTGTYTVGVAL
jgi:protocatechuate 3,4-dioxygenase beta subunit